MAISIPGRDEWNRDLYADGVINWMGEKRHRDILGCITDTIGLKFNRVKKQRVAKVIITIEDVLTYGKYAPGTRGWHLFRSVEQGGDGISRIGLLSGMDKGEEDSVLLHELGHAFGLVHGDGGLMDPPASPWMWYEPNHIETITRNFL